MGQMKFSCPSCSQKIEGTEDLVGQQIQCPACHQNIEVPPLETPPAAAESKPGLKIGLAAHQKSTPAPVASFSHGSNPVRHGGHAAGAADAGDRTAKIKRIVTIAACVLLIPAAGYFGYGAFRDYQSKKKAEAEKIAATNQIASAATNAESAALEEKAVPPKWTLDLTKVKLQGGRVQGKISGTNFVSRAAFLDITGPTHVLSLRETTNHLSDQELLLYLKLKPGESIAGQTWNISPDTRTNVPMLVKKWRPNPKFAPQQKSFANGYAMKLEFAKETNQLAQGRIFVALPDPEQTVVAGQFSATVRQIRPVAPAVPVRGQQQQRR
jgi:hypothetical protein